MNRSPHEPGRHGFTLVELLISIAIFVVLAGMAIGVARVTFDAERLRNGSQQVHSYLGGARDRAVYADAPRGVRFYVNPDLTEGTKLAVTSMVYVQQLEAEEGVGDFGAGSQTDFTPEAAFVTVLQGLQARGLLTIGTVRIRLANTAGSGGSLDSNNATWYPATVPDMTVSTTITLLSEYPNAGAADVRFAIELANDVLPGAEPVTLPRNIMVHLDNGTTSKLPYSQAAISAAGYFDVLFSPRGTVTGGAAQQGIVHLVVCDVEDYTAGRVSTYFASPSQAGFDGVEGGMRIVSVFTRTGQTVANELDPTQPFLYALTGEVSEE